MKEAYPYIRLALEKDYLPIWEIWMQKHIIRWMSFPPLSSEDFKDHFNRLKEQSDIYVMIDEIDVEEKVVGVRRIKYLSGKYSHIAEFCSMGIDIEMLGRGYGKKFTEECEKIVAKRGEIKRIQLTQSGGNNPAMSLSDKYAYHVEAVFPDWLEREGERGANHFVIERFIYKFLDKDLEANASILPSLKYEPMLPSLTKNLLENQVIINDQKNIITVLTKDQTLVLEFEYSPDESVIKHIAFIDKIILKHPNISLCEAAFRKILHYIYESSKLKKLEFFTHQVEVAELCQRLGFWVRGERLGVCQVNDNYCNELGVEYSYFGIEEAMNFIKSFSTEHNSTLEQEILSVREEISKLVDAQKCDILGSQYLQNIVYQMVRDSQQEKNYASLCDQPWRRVIRQCPEEFQLALQRLNKALLKFNCINKSASSLSDFFVSATNNKELDKAVPTVGKNQANINLVF